MCWGLRDAGEKERFNITVAAFVALDRQSGTPTIASTMQALVAAALHHTARRSFAHVGSAEMFDDGEGDSSDEEEGDDEVGGDSSCSAEHVRQYSYA